MSFAFASCNRNSENKEAQSSDSATQLLVVERQSVILSEDSPSVSVTVDVPIAGPKFLTDSVMEFLNREMYDFLDFSSGDTHHFSYEEVRTYDADYFRHSYIRHYAPLITMEEGWNVDKMAIVLISQTESFVTYGIEGYSCGASCCSGFGYTTFSKIDGHIVKEIINKKDLKKLVDEVVFENRGSSNFHYEPYYDRDCWGLCENGVAFVLTESGEYFVNVIDYEKVLPCLSDEARALVESMGDKDACRWKDWFFGARIGEVVNNEGRTIFLTEQSLCSFLLSDDDYVISLVNIFPDNEDGVEDFMDIFMDDDSDSCESSDVPLLRAFSIQEGVVVPEKVIDWHGEFVSEIVPNHDGAFTSLLNGNEYAFNPKDNTLYIPLPENVMMGHHVCADRYSVCQFDGNHFKYVRDDGGFWLHPSVRQFERMLLYGQAGPYLIRVDEMRIYDCRVEGQYEAEKRDSHRYRYVAWKNCDDTQQKPSLVIENGIYKDGDYIFENEGYTYVVKKNSLRTYQGNKQLSCMQLEKYVEYTD